MNNVPVSLLLLWATVVNAGDAPPVSWPSSVPIHNAMFCGLSGHEEISVHYSEALSVELDRLEKMGIKGDAAWRQMRSIAQCGLIQQSSSIKGSVDAASSVKSEYPRK